MMLSPHTHLPTNKFTSNHLSRDSDHLVDSHITVEDHTTISKVNLSKQGIQTQLKNLQTCI
jgi:hypothetical protein